MSGNVLIFIEWVGNMSAKALLIKPHNHRRAEQTEICKIGHHLDLGFV